jgi:haloacetate dehalogenase
MKEDLPMAAFAHFAEKEIALGEATIYARVGGSGPPLLLLHGYPQSHLMWAPVAERLASRFSVVAADMRGYGRSSAPASQKGERYSKRVMAKDAISLMQALGWERFAIAGHDRGGRVAYRLALDHPERVTKIAVLDIVPTAEMWAGMDAARAMTVYHWMFLAQPEPLPETLISGAPEAYLDHTLASWTGGQSLKSFSAEALGAYRAAFRDPVRVHATCEDYRAGATIDRALDEADRAAGRKIEAPLLALWGTKGIPARGESPLDVWKRWAVNVSGQGIDCGHFVPEEAPEATAAALAAFF